METKDPDFELVGRMAAADEAAMSVFYARHKALVGRLARNSGLGDAEARDLVQEAFLRAWRSAPSFKGLSSPRSWLCGIVRHLIADHIDAAVKSRAIFVAPRPGTEAAEEGNWQAADPGHGPEKLLELAQAKQCIAACLKKLGKLHREVLMLRICGPELKEQEVARVLGVPLGTVKSRTSIGLRALGQCVEACCEGDAAHA